MPFPQFSVVGGSQFEASSLGVHFGAVDSALVLLSSHLNLSSPSFSLWRAGLPASSPLVSGCFVELACCLGGVLSVFSPVPSGILASEVFRSVWLFGPHSGLTPGGLPSWSVALVESGSSPSFRV